MGNLSADIKGRLVNQVLMRMVISIIRYRSDRWSLGIEPIEQRGTRSYQKYVSNIDILNRRRAEYAGKARITQRKDG